MLALMMGAAMLTAQASLLDHHGAIMRAAPVYLQSRLSGAADAEGSLGDQFDFHLHPVRADVSFTAARWLNTDALQPGLIALVHRLKQASFVGEANGASSLPVAHLDPEDPQDQIARVGTTVHDLYVQQPIDIGGEGLRPLSSLRHGPHQAAGEDGAMQRAGVVGEGPDAGDQRRSASHKPARSGDHPEDGHGRWSAAQTLLGTMIVLASIVIDVCFILALVVMFEFVRSTDERVWPIRVVRTGVAASLVLSLAFAAFVHMG